LPPDVNICTRALANDTFEEMPQIAAQGQGRTPGARSILIGQITISKHPESDFGLRPAVCIGSERDHEFLMDLF
jgi:hypothetical protein